MDFFTWDILGIMAGTTFAVAILNEITKGIPGINKLPTQIWSLILVFVVLMGAQAAMSTLTLATGGIAVLNAAAGKPCRQRWIRPSGVSEERPECNLISLAARAVH